MIAYEIEQPDSSNTAGTNFNLFSIAEQEAVIARVRLAYISTLYVDNSNQERYGDLKTQLSNDYIMGTSKSTATLQEAQKSMNNNV